MAHPSSDSPRAQLFLGWVRDGRSLKWSARSAGVHLWTGYRWLSERYCRLRAEGLDPDAALQRLGCRSAKVVEWEALHQRRGGMAPRHHLSREVAVERSFWAEFDTGVTLLQAAASAGVGRSTAYRWWRRQFDARRDAGMPMPDVIARLRLTPAQAVTWEAARLGQRDRARRAGQAELRRAIRASALQDERVPHRGRRPGAVAAARDTRYRELMRQGLTNTEACRVLGVSRRVGTRIRSQRRYQTAPPGRDVTPSGRYLSLRERLQIADLTLMGQSMRQIAALLGRSPSTVKRELDRHRSDDGRYLPHRAQDRAVTQRSRSRPSKIIADPRLRRTIQRKLNRYWSPQHISGWVKTLPAGQTTVCAETIYQALIIPGVDGLHERWATLKPSRL